MNCPKELKIFDHILVESCGRTVKHGTVYFLYHRKKLVYIGKSKDNMKGRWGDHKRDEKKIFNRHFHFTLPQNDVKKVEEALIHLFKPVYNEDHKNREYTREDEIILSKYRNDTMQPGTFELTPNGNLVFSIANLAEVFEFVAGPKTKPKLNGKARGTVGSVENRLLKMLKKAEALLVKNPNHFDSNRGHSYENIVRFISGQKSPGTGYRSRVADLVMSQNGNVTTISSMFSEQLEKYQDNGAA